MRIGYFTMLSLAVLFILPGCRIIVQPRDKGPEPNPQDCNSQPSLPQCVKPVFDPPLGYKLGSTMQDFCLTSATSCGAPLGNPADIAWLKEKDSGQMVFNFSGNILVATDGDINFVARNMSGAIIDSATFEWSKTGDVASMVYPAAVDSWIDGLPDSAVSEVTATMPIGIAYQNGFNVLTTEMTYSSVPVHFDAVSFIESNCNGATGGLNNEAMRNCDNE